MYTFRAFNQWPIFDDLLIVSDFILLLIQLNFVTFYLILIWFASMSIQVVVEDVRTYSTIRTYAAGLRVQQWRRCYISISNFVKELDGFFGPFLLVLIGTWFALLSILLSQLIQMDEDARMDLVFVSIIFILLGTIVFATQAMKKKVQ